MTLIMLLSTSCCFLSTKALPFDGKYISEWGGYKTLGKDSVEMWEIGGIGQTKTYKGYVIRKANCIKIKVFPNIYEQSKLMIEMDSVSELGRYYGKNHYTLLYLTIREDYELFRHKKYAYLQPKGKIMIDSQIRDNFVLPIKHYTKEFLLPTNSLDSFNIEIYLPHFEPICLKNLPSNGICYVRTSLIAKKLPANYCLFKDTLKWDCKKQRWRSGKLYYQKAEE